MNKGVGEGRAIGDFEEASDGGEVFAGMPEVEDLEGVGEVGASHFPDPGGAIAQEDGLHGARGALFMEMPVPSARI